jgi:hypothetical protein
MLPDGEVEGLLLNVPWMLGEVAVMVDGGMLLVVLGELI